MTRPDCIIPVVTAARTTMRIARTGEALADTAILVSHPGLRVSHDILPPGRRSASPHAHTTQDELLYVLAGTPDLWLDGQLHRLQAGEMVYFAAGTGMAHTLINNSDQDVVTLAVALPTDGDQVHYPGNPDSEAPIADRSDRPHGAHDGRPGPPAP